MFSRSCEFQTLHLQALAALVRSGGQRTGKDLGWVTLEAGVSLACAPQGASPACPGQAEDEE